jgi:hypothetical protein
MSARGDDCRGIAAKLKTEGIELHFTTISRILKNRVRGNGHTTTRHTTYTPSPAPADNSHNETLIEERIVIPDDPRELAKQDWLYYEKLKEKLRRRADVEFNKENLRGARDLLREAQAAEKRAEELRPPIPPDPMKDPAYVAAAHDLTTYIEHLVLRAECGEAIPERTFPSIEPKTA